MFLQTVSQFSLPKSSIHIARATVQQFYRSTLLPLMTMMPMPKPMNWVVNWTDEMRNERRTYNNKCEPEGKQLLTDPEINSQMRPDNRHTNNNIHSTQHPVRYVRDYLPYVCVCLCAWVSVFCTLTMWLNEVLNDDVSMCSVDSIYKLIGGTVKREQESIRQTNVFVWMGKREDDG